MASAELSITDIFPMRKRRALGLRTTKENRKDIGVTKGEESMPKSCLLEIPIAKVSSSRKEPRNSPLGRSGEQLPKKTPTRRQNVSPSDFLGRLRKTPQRLAAWRSLSGCDSGPEITWDNDYHSPTNTINQGTRKGCSSKAEMQGQLASIIRKISKDYKKSLSKAEANLFDSWMRKDDGENSQSSKLVDRDCKKKRSVIHPRPTMQRMTQNWSKKTSNNAVKIQEELSHFIKDINEKVSTDEVKDMMVRDVNAEMLKASNVEEERMGNDTETILQVGALTKELAVEIQPVDLDLLDDKDWLDLEDLPIELKECGTNESGVICDGKCPKGDETRIKIGDCGAEVETQQFAAANVFSSDKCRANRRDSDPAIETDCYLIENLQPDGHKENASVQQEAVFHQKENRERRYRSKLFVDVPKGLSLTSQKPHKLENSAHARSERGKQRNYDNGTENVEADNRGNCKGDLPLERGKSSKQNIIDFTKGTNELCVDRKAVPDVKREFLTVRDKEGYEGFIGGSKSSRKVEKNEFSELVMSEDEFVFDELEDDINADRNRDSIDVVEDCNVSNLDCGDFGEDLFSTEEKRNENETVKAWEDVTTLREYTAAKEKEKVLKGKMNCEELNEVENDLDGIDFDDCGDLFNGSCLNDPDNVHRPMAGLNNAENCATSGSQMQMKFVSKANSEENASGIKKCFVESEFDTMKISLNKKNINTWNDGKRNDIASKRATDSSIKYATMDVDLNVETGKGDVIANMMCKDLERDTKLSAVVGHTKQRSLTTFGKFTEVNNVGDFDEPSVKNCLKNKRISSHSDAANDRDITFDANKPTMNNTHLIDIDLEMEDWDDEIFVHGDQFNNELKYNGDPITVGIFTATELKSETKDKSIKMLKETGESLDNAQRFGKESMNLKYDLVKCQDSKSQANKFRFKPTQNVHKEKSISRAVEVIEDHKSIKRCGIMQRATVENEHRNRNKTLFEPGVSMIAIEEDGESGKLVNDDFWDNIKGQLDKFSTPFTSTQKSGLPERFFPRKKLQAGKDKMYTAEEIEKKRAEAMKRLEQRKFKEKSRQLPSSK